MPDQSVFTLINQQNGNSAFSLFPFDDIDILGHLRRNNFFTLIWVMEGAGRVNADFNRYDFGPGSLFIFAPYQPYVLTANERIKGIAIYFHFDFFCIHSHQKELELNGVLYNNVYHPPFVKVDENAGATFKMLCKQIKIEMQNPALAQHELLVSYLKIFLITATRLKVSQQPPHSATASETKKPFILQKLKVAIEENFKTKHTASDYAELLYISPKALAKITKVHFNKTPSSLINERIIIEAKRKLYLTDKTVKEIAYELGYEDEYYFSRFFKVNTEVSPQLYRDTVGFAKMRLKEPEICF